MWQNPCWVTARKLLPVISMVFKMAPALPTYWQCRSLPSNLTHTTGAETNKEKCIKRDKRMHPSMLSSSRMREKYKRMYNEVCSTFPPLKTQTTLKVTYIPQAQRLHRAGRSASIPRLEDVCIRMVFIEVVVYHFCKRIPYQTDTTSSRRE